MQLRLPLITCALFATLPVLLSAQTAPAPAARKGIPPRAAAADYAGHGQAGQISIGGDFTGHDIPTLDATLTTEDYVAVEVGFYGAPGAHTVISLSDFSLRINGKKSGIPAEGFAVLARNLRDPTWEPPEKKEKEKSKGGINTGGGGQEDTSSTPAPVRIPPELERAMVLKVQAASLPEGDRALPVAGLIFFKYGGQLKGIRDVELVYAGAAGKTSIVLR